jgi:hypothetical protein
MLKLKNCWKSTIFCKNSKNKSHSIKSLLYCRQSGSTYSVQIYSVSVVHAKISNQKEKKEIIWWKIVMLTFLHTFCHNLSAKRQFCRIVSQIDITFGVLRLVYNIFRLNGDKVFTFWYTTLTNVIQPWPMVSTFFQTFFSHSETWHLTL